MALIGISGNDCLPSELRRKAEALVDAANSYSPEKYAAALQDLSNQIGLLHLKRAEKALLENNVRAAASSAWLSWFYFFDRHRAMHGKTLIDLLEKSGARDTSSMRDALDTLTMDKSSS